MGVVVFGSAPSGSMESGEGVSVVVLLPRLVPAVPKPLLLTFFWLFVGNALFALARMSCGGC